MTLMIILNNYVQFPPNGPSFYDTYITNDLMSVELYIFRYLFFTINFIYPCLVYN